MKNKTYAARFYADQISRIENGFRELGHEIIDNAREADILYSNDLEQIDIAIEDNNKYQTKYIQTLLDVPYHCWNKEDFKRVGQKLSQADQITTISDTVKFQIEKEFGFSSKTIYQPIKPISNLSLQKDIEFLMIGRLRDPNKRAALGVELIQKFRRDIPGVRAYTVGSEDINIEGINHLGILDDTELNNIYNRSKYVLCLGKIEGLNLPIVESICAGSIPISLSDSDVSFEFNPHAFISKPEVDEIYKKIQKLDFYYEDLVEGVVKPLAEIYQEKFSPKSVAARIIEAAGN